MSSERSDVPPKNNGRKSDGTFARGNRLGGKKPGARHRVTLAIEALLEGQHKALTRVAITKALAGDMNALRLCLERLAPPRKDAAISVALPAVRTAADAVGASADLLQAVSRGDITPGEASKVMALLSAHKDLIEACDFESRIAALEARS